MRTGSGGPWSKGSDGPWSKVDHPLMWNRDGRPWSVLPLNVSGRLSCLDFAITDHLIPKITANNLHCNLLPSVKLIQQPLF